MQDKNQPFQLDEEFVAMLTEAQQRLYGFILKRLVDHNQSNEVLQLTNIVLCRKANDFKKGTNFMAWALTVANFQILSFRKKQSRDRLIFSDKTFDQIVEEDGKRSDDTPSRLFHLKECLKKINKEDLKLLKMRYEQRLPFKEIAAASHKTSNAIRIQAHRIRNRLMNCVEKKMRGELA